MIVNSNNAGVGSKRHSIHLTRAKKRSSVVKLPVFKPNGFSEVPVILSDDNDEIEEIQRLNGENSFSLEVPMSQDARKTSMPIIRRPSQLPDIEAFRARKMSTVSPDRRSVQARSALYLPSTRSGSIRSKQSITNQFPTKYPFKLQPPFFQESQRPLRSESRNDLNSASSVYQLQTESRYQDEPLGELKFTTNLSKIGQCAMLKSYEDELYTQIKSKCPSKSLPRISTPTFNLQSSAISSKANQSISSSSFCSLPSCSSMSTQSGMSRKATTPASSWEIGESEQVRKYQVSRQIEDAMDLLDDLNKLKPLNEEADELTPINEFNNNSRSNSIYDANEFIDIQRKSEMDKAIKKYEKWQFHWSRMLNEMF